MITVRCPLRVSLFGGGSDYPAFSELHSGVVVGGPIDKYLYVSINAMPAFARERFRLTYRITESVDSIEEIQHPIVRAMLHDLHWKQPINIATMADVPGESGLGSSSAFTLALRAALAKFRGEFLSATELASYAIWLERVLLREAGGIQDHLYAPYGGLRRFDVQGWNFKPSTPILSGQALTSYSKNFLLVFTGSTRRTQEPAQRTQENLANLNAHDPVVKLARIAASAAEELRLAESTNAALTVTERALNEGWAIKASLDPAIAPVQVRDAVARGMSVGARAGKLLGSGGSGFLLFLVEPRYHSALMGAFAPGRVVPFRFREDPLRIQDLAAASGSL